VGAAVGAVGPETVEDALAFPPLMLTPFGPGVPFPPPVPRSAPLEPPVPPGEAAFPPALPVALALPFEEPPGTPGCVPSGETETLAERLPWGTAMVGGTGAGDAERAIRRREFASPFAAWPMSGAGPASAAAFWAWGRAAVAGNIGSFGCELTAGVAAILNGPGVFSRLLISGTGASSTLRRR
jgi:hypothetical protein